MVVLRHKEAAASAHSQGGSEQDAYQFKISSPRLREIYLVPSGFANFACFARVLFCESLTRGAKFIHASCLHRSMRYRASVLLTNETVVLSGDQEGTLIVPWPP